MCIMSDNGVLIGAEATELSNLRNLINVTTHKQKSHNVNSEESLLNHEAKRFTLNE